MAELGDVLRREVDVVHVRKSVKHAVRLYERRRGAFAQFISHALRDLETDMPAMRRMYVESRDKDSSN